MELWNCAFTDEPGLIIPHSAPACRERERDDPTITKHYLGKQYALRGYLARWSYCNHMQQCSTANRHISEMNDHTR